MESVIKFSYKEKGLTYGVEGVISQITPTTIILTTGHRFERQNIVSEIKDFYTNEIIEL